MRNLLTFLIILPLCLSGCEISYKKSYIAEANVVTQGIFLNAKVCLEGAYVSDSPLLMTSDLNDQNLLPTVSPFASAAPFYHYSFNDQILSQDILDLGTFVDWVVVEVYQYENGAFVYKDGQSAILHENGTLYDTMGFQGISFPTLLPGNYYFNILSRNHLSVASEDPTHLSAAYDENVYNIDFTDTDTDYLNEVTLSPHTTISTGTAKCLLAGDTNGDLMILADESDQNLDDNDDDLDGDVDGDDDDNLVRPDGFLLYWDIDKAIATVGYPANIAIFAYKNTDTNMDGQIQQFTDVGGTISSPDRALIITNNLKTGAIY